jgi:hypothetical protein
MGTLSVIWLLQAHAMEMGDFGWTGLLYFTSDVKSNQTFLSVPIQWGTSIPGISNRLLYY